MHAVRRPAIVPAIIALTPRSARGTPSLRRENTDAADLDADRTEISKSAKGEGSEEDRLWARFRSGFELPELELGDELVRDESGSEEWPQLGHVTALRPDHGGDRTTSIPGFPVGRVQSEQSGVDGMQ
jgi:hypothetical protein